MQLLNTKIDAAEKNLSHGKASGEDLKAMNPVLPLSLVARHKIALIMDSVVKGEYAYGIMKADLEEIRDAALMPDGLKVEAGYMLVLVEKMEALQKTAAAKVKECARESEEQRRNLEQSKKEIEVLKKENDDSKKEIEGLSYKLKKLEQIHLESVKRRGKQ
jgi:predicted RNase H-like nuclease (RuvC/YqgF family)